MKRTAVAPVSPVPVRVTLVPTGPEAGANPDILGAGMTMKLAALEATPPGVVTTIVPLVAPAGTVAVICVAESALKTPADTPLKATAVAPLKPLPARVTVAPTTPESGAMLEIAGGGLGVTEKLATLVALPP